MQTVTFHQATGEGDTGEDDMPAETFIPVTILNPWQNIRSFGPRKYGRAGTRIVYVRGAGLPVRETPEEVMNALNALQN